MPWQSPSKILYTEAPFFQRCGSTPTTNYQILESWYSTWPSHNNKNTQIISISRDCSICSKGCIVTVEEERWSSMATPTKAVLRLSTPISSPFGIWRSTHRCINPYGEVTWQSWDMILVSSPSSEIVRFSMWLVEEGPIWYCRRDWRKWRLGSFLGLCLGRSLEVSMILRGLLWMRGRCIIASLSTSTSLLVKS